MNNKNKKRVTPVAYAVCQILYFVLTEKTLMMVSNEHLHLLRLKLRTKYSAGNNVNSSFYYCLMYTIVLCLVKNQKWFTGRVSCVVNGYLMLFNGLFLFFNNKCTFRWNENKIYAHSFRLKIIGIENNITFFNFVQKVIIR